MAFAFRYPATITRIIDGDTVEAHIDMGLYQYAVHRLRLYGIDTPERNEMGYLEAKAFTASRVLMRDVEIRTYKADSFGRWLAELIYEDDQGVKHDLCMELLERGLAKPFVK